MRGAVALCVLLGACTGEITSPGESSKSGPGETQSPVCTSTKSPGAPVPMRRLTAAQVQRTVSQILGVSASVDVSDEHLFAFSSNISGSVDFVAARGYLDFAESVVIQADRSACATAGSACESWLFDDVARRLFRRPLADDERARYSTLFDEGNTEDGPQEGARWVLEALLQSPSFLYLDEVVDDSGYLDDYSIAARLALTLWGENPDQALLEKAAKGELSSSDQVVAEAKRLLADERSVGGLTDFVDQWLKLERLNDPDARPDLEALGAGTIAAMRAEPVKFLQGLIAQKAGLDAFLSSSQTQATDDLASLYGDDVLSTSGDTLELDPSRRAGVLSLPGVMAALSHAESTSPTLRGYAVLANFLCTPPKPPPAGISVTLPDIGPGKTTRERLEAHFSDPACASCHKPMDGMGFAFESIDWLGRSRDEEFGKPVVDTSSFPLDGETVTVEGPPGLAAAMVESPTVALCFARQWISYGAGIPDKKEAACLAEDLAKRVKQADGLKAMIVAFVSSDWFRRGAEVQP